jgi:hypothetical protein
VISQPLFQGTANEAGVREGSNDTSLRHVSCSYDITQISFPQTYNAYCRRSEHCDTETQTHDRASPSILIAHAG